MAVSKTFPAESIREAHAAGLRLFGENRVQEFAAKTEFTARISPVPTSTSSAICNRTRQRLAAELFHAVDSIDSIKLAEKLNAAAEKSGKILPVLIEINVGGEEAKTGVALGSGEFELHPDPPRRNGRISLRGLMTVPPYADDPEKPAPIFANCAKFATNRRPPSSRRRP